MFGLRAGKWHIVMYIVAGDSAMCGPMYIAAGAWVTGKV